MAEPGATPVRRAAGRLLAILGAALLTGCGGQAARVAVGVATAIATSRATPAAAPTHDPDTLVAVLERRGGAHAPNRVAIVGLDGYARAAATLVPRAVPTPGGLRAVLQPEARVAAGAVYYADGGGVVHRLAVGGGEPRTVATFPIGDGQVLAFAVSPDGLRFVATVLTVAPWHVDVETANAGGPTTTVRSIDVPVLEPGTAPRTLQMAGWDTTGPVALTDGVTAEPQDDGTGLWQGHPAQLDAHGATGRPMGGPGCGASFVEPDGILICDDPPAATTLVLRPDGSLLHRFTGTGPGPRLSPDATRLAYSLGGGRSAVQSLDGGVVALAPGFTPTGWLDSGTLIGTTRGDELAYVVLSAPGRAVDMGFPGSFVGVVHR
jgi:hypothetical protein